MSESWLDRLRMLVGRFPGYGISADLGAMSSGELWGVYRFLSNITEGVARG